jgi:hypothetical protein
MNKRKFNKKSYELADMPSKLVLKKLIEDNSEYVLETGLNEELYKAGDLVFRNGNKRVIFENEVRNNFMDIVELYTTIHIPIRKKNTPADFYIVWKTDFTQFILIDLRKNRKYFDNIVSIKCNEKFDNDEFKYTEDFIDMPKSETQWYVINEEFKPVKIPY